MQVMYVSAQPGQPSTFWQSESGKFYRTKREAESDKGIEVNPDDFEIKTSWFQRNKRTVVISGAVAIFVTIVTILIIRKYKF